MFALITRVHSRTRSSPKAWEIWSTPSPYVGAGSQRASTFGRTTHFILLIRTNKTYLGFYLLTLVPEAILMKVP